MTFDDDFMRLHLVSGTVDFTCQELGYEWPPPPEFDLNDMPGETLVRVGLSKLTDEQRAQMSHVARGAEYRYRDKVTET